MITLCFDFLIAEAVEDTKLREFEKLQDKFAKTYSDAFENFLDILSQSYTFNRRDIESMNALE